MGRKTIAIVVGTGLWRSLSFLQLHDKVAYHNRNVTIGRRSIDILYYETGFYKDLRVVILPRHGIQMDRPQRSPAELVLSGAHEAHIWFLSQLGVEEIYAFNTVGALDESLPLANTNTFIIPDDMCYGLGTPIHSFGTEAKYPHPEMNTIFSEELRQNLYGAVTNVGAQAMTTGTYIYSNLDHLETHSEGKALKRLFEHAKYPVVGSTAGAETVLCKELGLKYALLCSVSNYVQGISDKKVAHGDILRVIESASETLAKIVESLFKILNSSQTRGKYAIKERR